MTRGPGPRGLLAALIGACTALALAVPCAWANTLVVPHVLERAGSNLIATADNTGSDPIAFARFDTTLFATYTPGLATVSGPTGQCVPQQIVGGTELHCAFVPPYWTPGQTLIVTFATTPAFPDNAGIDFFACPAPCLPGAQDIGPFLVGGVPSPTPAPSPAPTPTPAPTPDTTTPTTPVVLTDPSRKAALKLDDLISAQPRGSAFSSRVKLGFGVIVVSGTDPDGVSLQGFVANATSNPMDLSVFGFEPQPLKAAAQTAPAPIYQAKVHLEAGDARVVHFKVPKRIAAGIRAVLKRRGRYVRKVTMTYRNDATKQSQTVVQKIVERAKRR